LRHDFFFIVHTGYFIRWKFVNELDLVMHLYETYFRFRIFTVEYLSHFRVYLFDGSRLKIGMQTMDGSHYMGRTELYTFCGSQLKDRFYVYPKLGANSIVINNYILFTIVLHYYNKRVIPIIPVTYGERVKRTTIITYIMCRVRVRPPCNWTGQPRNSLLNTDDLRWPRGNWP